MESINDKKNTNDVTDGYSVRILERQEKYWWKRWPEVEEFWWGHVRVISLRNNGSSNR